MPHLMKIHTRNSSQEKDVVKSDLTEDVVTRNVKTEAIRLKSKVKNFR